jgi:peptidoglycan hydrolase-like protein with peptidoglycan-binding domain
MNDPEGPPTDRESPVGEPVIRGDPELAGEHAARFDPSDPASVEAAVRTVQAFAGSSADGGDNVYVLQGAAACAAIVRGVGSYKAAAERVGGDATVSFIRKWARVHDLPRPIRRYVATGRIAPTAAKHIARVAGEGRYTLAWAVLDHGLTVREIRAVVSRVHKNQTVEEALLAEGIRLGEMRIRLPPGVYRRLRRAAATDDVEPAELISRALETYLGEE